MRMFRLTGLRLLAVAGMLVLVGAASGIAAALPRASSGPQSPATAAQQVRAIAACTKPVYQPTHFVITCADAGIRLNSATYSWWTTHTAHGKGVYYFNDCTPSCAGGTFHSQWAAFTLYRVVTTSKFGKLFTRIEIDTRQGHHVFSLPTSPI